MGYSLFSQNKLALQSSQNFVQLNQMQRSQQQQSLAANTVNLQSQVSQTNIEKASLLQQRYDELTLINREDYNSDDAYQNAMQAIKDEISKLTQEYEIKQNQINAKISTVQAKEDAIDLEIKRLDTKLATLQKQYEAVEKAEGDAIDKATPKFNGNG